MIKLNYIDVSGVFLGEEVYKSINEVLIYGEKSYITKKFSGDLCYRWKITGFTRSFNNGVHSFDIVCERADDSLSDKYLFKINNETGGKTKRYIKVGTVVEVDIGFIPSVYKSLSTRIGVNKRYTDFIHKPEPYKRRMGVVVSNQGDDGYYMIVLVTSDPSSKNNSITLSSESTRMLPSYNNKTSYVICDMIFPASFTRILPPKIYNPQKSYRDNKFPTRLIKGDLKKLQEKICDVFELPYMQWLYKVNAEKSLLEAENNKLKTTIEKLLLPLKELYGHDNIDSIIDEIDDDDGLT